MANMLDVFSSIFVEEKTKPDKSKSLKIFYNMDIHIKNPNKNPPEQAIQQEPTTQPVVPQQPIQAQVAQAVQAIPPEQMAVPVPVAAESKILKKAKMIMEDDFNLKNPGDPDTDDYEYNKEGIISVPREEYENIQTLEDLLDFVSDSRDEKGNQILDEAAVELILAMTGITQTPLEDLIKKEDRVVIDLVYGNKKEDSIGFKVLKRDGVNNLSIVMKKNNDILDSKFDLKQFNSQILQFRNGIINARQ